MNRTICLHQTINNLDNKMSKPQAPGSKGCECLLNTAAVSTQDVFDSAALTLRSVSQYTRASL